MREDPSEGNGASCELPAAARDVDRADRVLVGQLLEHLAHDGVHVGSSWPKSSRNALARCR